MYGLAVLRKDRHDVTLRQVEREAADVDVGRITVISVP